MLLWSLMLIDKKQTFFLNCYCSFFRCYFGSLFLIIFNYFFLVWSVFFLFFLFLNLFLASQQSLKEKCARFWVQIQILELRIAQIEKTKANACLKVEKDLLQLMAMLEWHCTWIIYICIHKSMFSRTLLCLMGLLFSYDAHLDYIPVTAFYLHTTYLWYSTCTPDSYGILHSYKH